MACALSYSSPSSSSNTSIILQSSPAFSGYPRLSNLLLPRRSIAASTLAFSRRPNHNSPITSSSKKKNKASFGRDDVAADEDDVDEDAFDAVFSMLEVDLKNNESFLDDADDLNEEDLIKLQSELEDAFGVADDEDDSQVVDLNTHDADHSNDDGEIGEDEEEVERPLQLKNWQLQRLALALKKGRRKVSIKSLAGELCLDRAVVLQMLRDPPPNLVMLSAALPDEPAPTPLVQKTRHLIAPEEQVTENVVPSTKEVKMPVHVMRHRWDAQKRLKKVHVDTLEKVYRKTKRPTNTMISSIVQVTNLPRKRVVKWFEDKRNEDGIPEQRLPYQRSISKSVSS